MNGESLVSRLNNTTTTTSESTSASKSLITHPINNNKSHTLNEALRIINHDSKAEHALIAQNRDYVNSVTKGKKSISHSIDARWTVGCEGHLKGLCSPCIWYHNSEVGCRYGALCRFCHFCPIGEIKMRKRTRKQLNKILLEQMQYT